MTVDSRQVAARMTANSLADGGLPLTVRRAACLT